eukprot:UC4_evm3s420
MTVPLAVQQWRGIIACCYAAKKQGVTRFMSIEKAKKICPELRFVHVDLVNDKVSLEPYRDASRNIFSVLTEVAASLQGLTAGAKIIIEKASVDEAYIDVTSLAQAQLKWEHGQSSLVKDMFASTHVLGLSSNVGESSWNRDVTLLVGAQIAAELRAAILTKTGYTCSAGIACNKLFAKIGSGKNKPCGSTILPIDAAKRMLKTMSIKDVPLFGGKLGKSLIDAFQNKGARISTVAEVLSDISLLHSCLGENQASWVISYLHGNDPRQVEEKGPQKSILEAHSRSSAVRLADEHIIKEWLERLAKGLSTRIFKDRELNQRWPSKITVQWREARSGIKEVSRVACMPKERANLTAAICAENIVEISFAVLQGNIPENVLLNRLALSAGFSDRSNTSKAEKRMRDSLANFLTPKSSPTDEFRVNYISSSTSKRKRLTAMEKFLETGGSKKRVTDKVNPSFHSDKMLKNDYDKNTHLLSLLELGIGNESQCQEALRSAKGDIELAAAIILSETA